jgi:hypothetical protein
VALFGRGSDEDPLGGLGGQAADRSAGEGVGEGTVLLVWFVVTVALAAFVLIRAEHNALHDPLKRAARGEIKGFGKDSLLRPERFAKALAKSDAHLGDGGYLLAGRLDPVQWSTTVRHADYKERVVTVGPSLEVADHAFSESEDKGLRAGQVPAGAPQRILATIARREGKTLEAQADDLDYLALSTRADVEGVVIASWSIRFRSGQPSKRDWYAQLDGSDVYRNGEPDPVQQRRQKAVEAAYARIDKRYEFGSDRWTRARDCVSRASTPTGIRRCAR